MFAAPLYGSPVVRRYGISPRATLALAMCHSLKVDDDCEARDRVSNVGVEMPLATGHRGSNVDLSALCGSGEPAVPFSRVGCFHLSASDGIFLFFDGLLVVGHVGLPPFRGDFHQVAIERTALSGNANHAGNGFLRGFVNYMRIAGVLRLLDASGLVIEPMTVKAFTGREGELLGL